MEYAPEEYTKHYIVTALFKLMHAYEYEKIKVTDIAQKAGIGRATFYRYFKSKEDVITYYFEHHTREFVFGQHIYPRCKEDYVKVVSDVLGVFKANKEPFKLLKRAHLSDLYLNFLNKKFSEMFTEEHPDKILIFRTSTRGCCIMYPCNGWKTIAKRIFKCSPHSSLIQFIDEVKNE